MRQRHCQILDDKPRASLLSRTRAPSRGDANEACGRDSSLGTQWLPSHPDMSGWPHRRSGFSGVFRVSPNQPVRPVSTAGQAQPLHYCPLRRTVNPPTASATSVDLDRLDLSAAPAESVEKWIRAVWSRTA